MKKLKNTVQNELIVTGATIGAFSLAFLYMFRKEKKEDLKKLIIVGAIFGIGASMGTINWFVEKSEEKK